MMEIVSPISIPRSSPVFLGKTPASSKVPSGKETTFQSARLLKSVTKYRNSSFIRPSRLVFPSISAKCVTGNDKIFSTPSMASISCFTYHGISAVEVRKNSCSAWTKKSAGRYFDRATDEELSRERYKEATGTDTM